MIDNRNSGISWRNPQWKDLTDFGLVASLFGLSFGEAYTGDLRVAVDAARNQGPDQGIRPRGTCDPFNTQYGFVTYFVGKTWLSCHIAYGINTFRRRLTRAIGLDETMDGQEDTRLFKTNILSAMARLMKETKTQPG